MRVRIGRWGVLPLRDAARFLGRMSMEPGLVKENCSQGQPGKIGSATGASESMPLLPLQLLFRESCSRCQIQSGNFMVFRVLRASWCCILVECYHHTTNASRI